MQKPEQAWQVVIKGKPPKGMQVQSGTQELGKAKPKVDPTTEERGPRK